MTYCFERFVLHLESETGALRRRADQVLQYHRFQPVRHGASPDWTIRLVVKVPEEPSWPIAFEAGACRLRIGEEGCWLQYGAVAFAGSGSEWEGYVPAGCERLPDFAYGLVLVMCLLLREQGWFGLHGAGLVYQGQGVLLVGRSGVGKSTLAYSLVRCGWHFLTDDALMIYREGDGIEAVSFRKDFGLEVGSARYFPELAVFADRQPTDPNKRRIQVECLYPDRFCVRCRPALLVFPERAHAVQSRLQPLRRSEAFVRLLQAGLMLWRADDPMEWRLLEVMRRLVQQAPAYLLQLGLDVFDQPERLERLLHPMQRLVHQSGGGSWPVTNRIRV
ncbi:MAG: serine kinase [Rhodothermus sp.]|nr:serine kinase [Rhodothermus sp.]